MRNHQNAPLPPRCNSTNHFKETLRLRQSKMVAELRRNLSDTKD